MPSWTIPRLAPVAWSLAAFGVIAGSVWLTRDHRAYNSVLLAAYLPSLLVAAAGCLVADRQRERRGESPLTASWPPRARWLAAALVMVAGVARVWGFPDWPPSHGLGFEEEELGGAATNLLEQWSHPPEHRLPTYAAALGFTLLGPSITSLRVVFVAMSALAPLLFLGACRRLARPPVALLCTALYGFSWWATAAGRFADEIYFVAPLTAAVVWLLLVVLDEKPTLAALGLGLLSGALVFEYTAYRLVPLLVTGYLLLKLAARGWRALRTGPDPSWRTLATSFRPVLALATTFAIGLAVSALPAAIAFLHRHDSSLLEAFTRHTGVPEATVRQAPGELAELVLARSGHLVRALVVPDQGEPIPWMNSEPYRPNLGPVAGAVLGAGCLLALLNLGRRLHLLLAVWIAVSAGTALAVPLNENTMRYFTVFPVAWLLAASGLERAWPSGSRPRVARALAVVAAVTAGTVAVSDAVFLHRRLAPDDAVRRTFASRCVTTARFIGALPPGSRTVLSSEVCGNISEHQDLRWLLAGREVVAVESLAETLQPRQTAPGPVFLVAATTIAQPGLGPLLVRRLPGSSVVPPDRWPRGDLDLVALRLQPAQAAERRRQWGPGTGGFMVQSFEGPATEPAGPGQPPVGSTLFEAHGEPVFSSLGQRRSTLEHAESLRGSPDTVYWVAWTGAAAPPPGCRGVRLRLRSGYGWLWLDGALALTAGYRGADVVVEEKAMHFQPGQIVSVEACSYHVGNDPPALQVEWLDAGPGELLSGVGQPAFVD
ncbi:MAG: hypothetical protein AB2L07_10500 [Thermoanaerobaculaceae bacterium]